MHGCALVALSAGHGPDGGLSEGRQGALRGQDTGSRQVVGAPLVNHGFQGIGNRDGGRVAPQRAKAPLQGDVAQVVDAEPGETEELFFLFHHRATTMRGVPVNVVDLFLYIM